MQNRNAKDQLIQVLAKECRTVEDIQEKLKELFRDTIQNLLEAEMDNHLGYTKHSPEGDHSGNSRNGYSSKILKTKFGPTEIEIPRDRNGDFEPHIVKNMKKRRMVSKIKSLLCMPKGC